MFLAELLGNGRSGRGIIANKLYSCALLDGRNQPGRKSQEHREWLVQNGTGNFPMSSGGVFPGGALLHFAEAGKMRQTESLVGPGIIFVQNLRQSERTQVRQPGV